MGSGRRVDNVKVVLIDTQHVVTDPGNFKSVVQSLTGKDSCVGWIEENSFSGTKRKRSSDNIYNGGVKKSSSGDDEGLSFNDLDSTMLELLPIEEWQQLWAQYN